MAYLVSPSKQTIALGSFIRVFCCPAPWPSPQSPVVHGQSHNPTLQVLLLFTFFRLEQHTLFNCILKSLVTSFLPKLLPELLRNLYFTVACLPLINLIDSVFFLSLFLSFICLHSLSPQSLSLIPL